MNEQTIIDSLLKETEELKELLNKKKTNENEYSHTIPYPHNRIVFGAPGTGKSFRLKEEAIKYFDKQNINRVTFHPNYSYSSFVGTYKPVQDKDDNSKIRYKFIPGPFLSTLVNAMKNITNDYLLIIEEINRANVAAVFGDMFQLLDRDKDDNSEYPVDTSEDIKKYLESEEITDNKTLSIPHNMFIWATMNSADQGVFPLDTAFKRRWEFEYIGINDNKSDIEKYNIPLPKNSKYNWNTLRIAINNKLIDLKINEDKLLGPFFLGKKILENAIVKRDEFINIFKSKILMYLFEDVIKIKASSFFNIKSEKYIYSEICKEFDEYGIGIFNFLEDDKNKLEKETTQQIDTQ